MSGTLFQKKIQLHNVVISFPHVFTPTKYDDNQKPKYQCSFIIPKTDMENIKKVTAAVMECKAKIKENYKKKAALEIKNHAVRDGDTMGREEYKGAYVLAAKSSEKRRPLVVNRNNEPIMDQSEIYAGAIVNADITIYIPPNYPESIAASLNVMQKVKDGEPIGGGIENPFGALAETGETGAGEEINESTEGLL